MDQPTTSLPFLAMKGDSAKKRSQSVKSQKVRNESYSTREASNVSRNHCITVIDGYPYEFMSTKKRNMALGRSHLEEEIAEREIE